MNEVNYQEAVEKIKEAVANHIKKICEENLIQDHQCKGVIPDTFIMCGEDDFQYCSDACLTIAKAKEYFTNLLNNPKDNLNCNECPANDICPGFNHCPYFLIKKV